MKVWRMDRGTIAIWVPVGEAPFHRYQTTLGAPALRYFASGGSEFARQWFARRRANARIFLRLRRLLPTTGDDIVEVAGEQPERRAA